MKTLNLNLRAAVVSLLMLVCVLGAWHLATTADTAADPTAGMTAEEIEYAKMMGKDPGAPKSGGFPTLGAMGSTVWSHLSNPFYDNGPNDKGIAI
ncbi:MAG: nitrate ABC transporter, permease protein, partial [Gammaproteobacteria bacterium]